HAKWISPNPVCLVPSAIRMVASMLQSPISQPYRPSSLVRSAAGPSAHSAVVNEVWLIIPDPRGEWRPIFALHRRRVLGKIATLRLMSISALTLASGTGWRVDDVRCTSGPRDRPFEERHSGMCIAVVVSGTFTYRTPVGTAVLAPGAAMLGNHEQCFECGHEHGVGDRCLSFHFSPELVESVVSDLPGARPLAFSLPALPPVPEL